MDSLITTAAFPEHTSGHNKISRAATVVLTSIFGEYFSYDDDVELEYGVSVRKFNSFIHALKEAVISRAHGGIHYRPAIDYDVSQDEALGKFIVHNISMTH